MRGLHQDRHHRRYHGDRGERDYGSPAGPGGQQTGDLFTPRRIALIVERRCQPVGAQQGRKGRSVATAIIHGLAND